MVEKIVGNLHEDILCWSVWTWRAGCWKFERLTASKNLGCKPIDMFSSRFICLLPDRRPHHFEVAAWLTMLINRCSKLRREESAISDASCTRRGWAVHRWASCCMQDRTLKFKFLNLGPETSTITYIVSTHIANFHRGHIYITGAVNQRIA